MRLAAHRPNRLHDGDEIRLGQMVMRIYFQVGDEHDTLARKARLEAQKNSPQPDSMDSTRALNAESLKPEPAKPDSLKSDIAKPDERAT
jgi:predicted component of type VI protein secretion system